MYDVKFVKSEQLPRGQDWFIARRGCDEYVFMLDPSKLSEDMLKEAWIAYCELERARRRRVVA